MKYRILHVIVQNEDQIMDTYDFIILFFESYSYSLSSLYHLFVFFPFLTVAPAPSLERAMSSFHR